MAALRAFLYSCQTLSAAYLSRMDGRHGYRDDVLALAMAYQPWDEDQLFVDLKRTRGLLDKAMSCLSSPPAPIIQLVGD